MNLNLKYSKVRLNFGKTKFNKRFNILSGYLELLNIDKFVYVLKYYQF